MNESQQAEALARWLDAGAVGDPPDGVDPDVVEALFVLRPDLAPPPRVGVDDILAGVTDGPFAELPLAADPVVVPFPVRPSMPDLHQVPEPPARDPRRWWLAGGLAGVAAAAAAVALVLPATLQQAAPTVAAQQEAASSAPVGRYDGGLFRPEPPPAAAPAPALADDAVVDAEPEDEADALRSLGYVEERARPSADRAARTAAPPAPPAPDAEEAQRAYATADGAAFQTAEEVQTAAPQRQAVAGAGADGMLASEPPREPDALGAPAAASRAAAKRAAPTEEAELAPAKTSADARVERMLAEASRIAQTDPLSAAQLAAKYIGDPPIPGQRAALNAALWAMRAGRPDLAWQYAVRGLALQGTGPDRTQLSEIRRQAEAAQGEAVQPMDADAP